MEDVAVEMFNGFVKRTVSYGALKPKTCHSNTELQIY